MVINILFDVIDDVHSLGLTYMGFVGSDS